MVSGWLELGGFAAGAGGTAFATGGMQLTALGSAVAGATGGFAAGLVGSGGDIRAGMQGALSGALFGAAGHAGGFGEAGANTWERYAAHAGAGCVSSVAGGGNCGQGAVSAVFGKYTSNTINGWGGDNIQGIIARGVATSVAGGVGSVIAGGKFANGAETAAYGYLFNQMQTVMRHAFSSNLMAPNWDIGHQVVEATRDGLIQTGEVGAKAIAACGVLSAPCRSADALLSWGKIGVDLVSKGDGSSVPGQIAGSGAEGLMANFLKVANNISASVNRLSNAFVQGAAYVSGKIVEAQVNEAHK